jgi:hypothetical protein
MSEMFFMLLVIAALVWAILAYIQYTRSRSRWIRDHVYHVKPSDFFLRTSRFIFKHYVLGIVLPVVLIGIFTYKMLGWEGVVLGVLWLGGVELFWKVTKRGYPEFNRRKAS